MFFAKNEIIELEDKKNYLILDTAIIENEVFYQVQEVDDNGDNVTGPKTLIYAINDEENLYINNVTDQEKITQLNEKFAS